VSRDFISTLLSNTTVMRNPILIIIVIALIALGAVLFKQPQQIENQATVVTGVTSFVCENQSYFVTEFMSDETARILVDGDVIRTVSKKPVNREQYDDDTFSYIFESEKVIVANKDERTLLNCNQTTDQNTQESVMKNDAQGDELAVVAKNLLGAWRSLEDEKFVRTFKDSNQFVDSYEGEALTQESYELFKKGDNAPETSIELEDDVLYLLSQTETEPTESMLFKIVTVTEERLEMIYLQGNGSLVFERVTE